MLMNNFKINYMGKNVRTLLSYELKKNPGGY